MRTCSFEGCDRRHNARGLCAPHAYQWKTWGELRPIYSSPKDRFWSYVDTSGECWEWNGDKTSNGYGRISIVGRNRRAHRVAYEWEHGPIPDGVQVDHMCWNRSCVRPSHLRLADSSENQQNQSGLNTRNTSGHRGVSWSKDSKKWRAIGVLNGKQTHLGFFSSAEEANAAAVAWRRKHYTHSIMDQPATAGFFNAQEAA